MTFDHGGKEGTDREERGGEIGIDDLAPVGGRFLRGGHRHAVASGEGDEDVRCTELFGDLGGESVNVRRHRAVRSHADGTPATTLPARSGYVEWVSAFYKRISNGSISNGSRAEPTPPATGADHPIRVMLCLFGRRHGYDPRQDASFLRQRYEADAMTERFKGVVNVDIRDSVPDWTPFEAPKAPEQCTERALHRARRCRLLGDECYGGPIPTPNIDRIVDNGVRYTQMHTTALCSPTRSCLLTGRNHTRNSMACITEAAIGFPNASGVIPPENGQIQEILGGAAGTPTWSESGTCARRPR